MGFADIVKKSDNEALDSMAGSVDTGNDLGLACTMYENYAHDTPEE